ncbi:MAG: hypothetical protein L0Y72_02790 [Gemmataceae bacterium]|nr:hypothetical protein [Gemmataceae bacterium]MCI0737944.1 hypothetical protein [Gemmataceae bacterium]
MSATLRKSICFGVLLGLLSCAVAAAGQAQKDAQPGEKAEKKNVEDAKGSPM